MIKEYIEVKIEDLEIGSIFVDYEPYVENPLDGTEYRVTCIELGARSVKILFEMVEMPHLSIQEMRKTYGTKFRIIG